MTKRPLGPTVSQRIIGAELRMLREAAGLTCKEVSERVNFSEAKVSRIETARNSVTPNDLKFLLDAYDVTADKRAEFIELVKPRRRQKSWWNAYRDIVPERRWVYVRLEDEAEGLRNYETAFIPGLLQTADYADAIMKVTSPEATAEVRQRRVDVRLARQQVLTREFPVHLWAIIDEAALLRTKALPAAVANEQFLHLVEAAKLPSVTIQVLPLSVGPHPAMDGAFTIIDFPDPAGQVVFLDSRTGGMYLEEDEEIRAYDQDFDHLRAEALGKKDSAALLEALARDN
ncbi:transcriptional regulator [Actinorhabdospora filicis]|uniref:Transcriptional regulator n=1 Tax=Actinorhabdospora filicis TaxID=1785913 RepID=A0A9W6SJG6_9ACTN|nr:helix-turn-helix transcriptional regulator [Actinorhabdospora filicis]GLZ78179.1 transcriptional regulator [Actinorhabdospora filicis]